MQRDLINTSKSESFDNLIATEQKIISKDKHNANCEDDENNDGEVGRSSNNSDDDTSQIPALLEHSKVLESLSKIYFGKFAIYSSLHIYYFSLPCIYL